ncbi:MAG: hypothetical protein QOF25_86 [Mycobacterium sp.]|nr:hypothetical protein [Mycobacterium sp.]
MLGDRAERRVDGAIADQSDIQPGVLDERERAADRTINPVVFIAEYPAPTRVSSTVPDVPVAACSAAASRVAS